MYGQMKKTQLSGNLKKMKQKSAAQSKGRAASLDDEDTTDAASLLSLSISVAAGQVFSLLNSRR